MSVSEPTPDLAPVDPTVAFSPPIAEPQPGQPTPDADVTATPPDAAVPDPQPVAPIRVDSLSARSDADALEGHFVYILSGEFEGRYAAFEKVLESDADGYPSLILVRTRDADSLLVAIPYGDVARTDYKGGR